MYYSRDALVWQSKGILMIQSMSSIQSNCWRRYIQQWYLSKYIYCLLFTGTIVTLCFPLRTQTENVHHNIMCAKTVDPDVFWRTFKHQIPGTMGNWIMGNWTMGNWTMMLRITSSPRVSPWDILDHVTWLHRWLPGQTFPVILFCFDGDERGGCLPVCLTVCPC